MKILSFFSRATIILFLQIFFVASLTVSFCEPVFAAKSSKKKKSKKKKSKKKSAKKKRAEKRKAEAKRQEKEKEKEEEKKAEEKPAPKPISKSQQRRHQKKALTKFQTETTYWCGKVYCDKAQDDDDAACLLSSGNKPMQCIYGNIKLNPRDKSLKKLKKRPEDDTGMEMCLYELRALCGGYSASLNNDKDMVSAQCEKDGKIHRCIPAFENVPPAPVTPESTQSFLAASAALSSPPASSGALSSFSATPVGTLPSSSGGAASSPVVAGGPVAPGATPPIRPVVVKGAAAPIIPGTSQTPPVTTVK